MENKDLVLKTLKDAGKPLKGGEISEASGVEKKEVDKIIKQLKKNDEIISPKRCYYSPK